MPWDRRSGGLGVSSLCGSGAAQAEELQSQPQPPLGAAAAAAQRARHGDQYQREREPAADLRRKERRRKPIAVEAGALAERANPGHRAARRRVLLILWSALLYQMCSRFRGGLILTSIWGLYLLAVQSGAREASTDREKLLDFRGLLCTSEEKNIKHITRSPRLIITTHSYFLSKLVGKPNRVNCPDWLGIDR